MVYFSDTPSLAVLEKQVHLDPDLIGDDYLLGTFEINVSTAFVEDLPAFPGNWISDIAGTAQCGTQWLTGNNGILLSVPSAIVPEQRNFLLNPVHPGAAQLRSNQERPFRFDSRLLG